MYKCMIYTEEVDTYLNKAQRQGTITFYMPSWGE